MLSQRVEFTVEISGDLILVSYFIRFGPITNVNFIADNVSDNNGNVQMEKTTSMASMCRRKFGEVKREGGREPKDQKCSFLHAIN